MAKRRSDVSRRAWNVLRLPLLWARKGGVFRLVPKYLKSLRHPHTPADRLHLGERQLSLGFLLPCIGPQEVDFEYKFDDDDDVHFYGDRQIGFLKGSDDCHGDEAERFITNLYQQMKMQRQISYLEYNEMLKRGAY